MIQFYASANVFPFSFTVTGAYSPAAFMSNGLCEQTGDPVLNLFSGGLSMRMAAGCGAGHDENHNLSN
jgi:hypothetical protein